MNRDEFKVEDTVYCVLYGKGKCIKIYDDERDYSVDVKFETGIVLSYTASGKYEADGIRTLFFEEIKIPESAYKRPRWRAEKLDNYCFVAGTGLLLEQKEFGSIENNAHYETGNYFKSEQEAKESKFYKVFHEEE